MSRLSPAARHAIRRMMRRRPGAAHGNPLPPPGGTSAFWLMPCGGHWTVDGPAIQTHRPWLSFPVRLWIEGATPSAALSAVHRSRPPAGWAPYQPEGPQVHDPRSLEEQAADWVERHPVTEEEEYE